MVNISWGAGSCHNHGNMIMIWCIRAIFHGREEKSKIITWWIIRSGSEGESSFGSRGDGRIKSSDDGGERIAWHWIRTSFNVENFLVYSFGHDLGKRVDLTFLCFPGERRRRQWATATMIWRTGWQIEWAISTWYFNYDCLFELRFPKRSKGDHEKQLLWWWLAFGNRILPLCLVGWRFRWSTREAHKNRMTILLCDAAILLWSNVMMTICISKERKKRVAEADPWWERVRRSQDRRLRSFSFPASLGVRQSVEYLSSSSPFIPPYPFFP